MLELPRFSAEEIRARAEAAALLRRREPRPFAKKSRVCIGAAALPLSLLCNRAPLLRSVV